MTLAHCDNFTLYRIQLRNSPNFAVSYAGGNGFTVWGVVINQAKDALNGDGINLGQPWPEVSTPTTNVTITHSYIYAGDDNLAIKSRTGSHTDHVSVLHNHFYAGHGVGTGSSTSGGISNVRISDLTLDGTSTGINMKSNDKLGGLVHDVEFNDMCIRGSGSPISIGTHSGSTGHHEVDATESNKPPQYTDIRLSNILIEGGGWGRDRDRWTGCGAPLEHRVPQRDGAACGCADIGAPRGDRAGRNELHVHWGRCDGNGEAIARNGDELRRQICGISGAGER